MASLSEPGSVSCRRFSDRSLATLRIGLSTVAVAELDDVHLLAGPRAAEEIDVAEFAGRGTWAPA